MGVATHSEVSLSLQSPRLVHVPASQMKARTQQHDSSLLAEADASCRRGLRDLRCQCQRLSNSNLELKIAADSARTEASVSRRSAAAARKELEAERRAGAELRRVRESLLEAATVDKKNIASLQAQMSKGVPSSRLLERARRLKQTADVLQKKSNDQALALSAKTADLEIARRDLRALTTALDIKTEGIPTGGTDRSVTAGELLEVGRARLANHDLALELAYMSETSGGLAFDKEELKKRLLQEADRAKKCQAGMAALQGALDQQKKAADANRVELSKAHTSTREAREIVEALQSREKELLGDVDTTRSRCGNLGRELAALSGVMKRGEATFAELEEMREDLKGCEAALALENDRNQEVSAKLRASEENAQVVRQRLEVLEGAELEGRRLADLLQEERALQNALREDAAAARAELREALEERAKLVRGLRQAKVFNDELAEVKEKAEEREREACAQCVDVREGKLALQRALLEQLSVARAGLREEKERREEAEAALSTLTGEAAATPNNRVRSPSEKLADSDGEDGATFFQSDDHATLPSRRFRPRDTLVQDYLGREGAEQFLSDWDEERSSSSSSSPSSPPSLESPVPLPPATAFAVDGESDAVDATRCLQESAPIEPPPPLPPPSPPPKAVAVSMNITKRLKSASQTHAQDVQDSTRSGGWGGGTAKTAIAGRSGIPTREGRMPPSVPADDAVGAGAKHGILCKVSGDTTSSARLAPGEAGPAAQTSDLSERSCVRPPCPVSKVGDAVVLTAVPAQDGLEARGASARHSPKSDADGVVSEHFSRRRFLSRSGVHQRSGNSSSELSTDPATTTTTAANPSPKTLESRFESEGGDTDDGGDDRASGKGDHRSGERGGVRVRKSGAIGVGIGATGGAGAVCEVDGGKVGVEEAVASALPAVGRRKRPPRSSLLDLAYQSIDDI